MLNRRLLLAAGAAIAACRPAVAAAGLPKAKVYKTRSCGCCQGWITAMEKAGFTQETVVVEDVSPLWRERGVPDALSSCHLADIGGYVTVGHVPPEDVKRLLREKPKAIGLTVPGMVMGSPGMETPSGRVEPYETLLVLKGGATRVWAKHG